jgi:hypothetical protein
MEDFLTIKLSRSESFRALKLSRLENFLTLKYKTLKENFRALKLSILVRSINDRKEQSEHTCRGFDLFIYNHVVSVGAAWIILALIKRCVKF